MISLIAVLNNRALEPICVFGMPAIISLIRMIVIHVFVHVISGSFHPVINLNIPPVAVQVVVEWHAEHDCYGLVSTLRVVGKHTHTSRSYRTFSLPGSIG